MPRHLRAVDPMPPCTTCPEAHTRCKGHRRDGKPCTQWPVKGTRVCKMHGGKAPQVQRTARQRLLEAADPAAARLVQLLDSDDPQIALRAATALLDRAGHGPGVKIGDERSEAEVDREIEALLEAKKAAG